MKTNKILLTLLCSLLLIFGCSQKEPVTSSKPPQVPHWSYVSSDTVKHNLKWLTIYNYYIFNDDNTHRFAIGHDTDATATDIHVDFFFRPFEYLAIPDMNKIKLKDDSITNIDIANSRTAYSWGNHSGLYPLLSGSYSNPTWINSLAYSKLTGAPTISGATGSYGVVTTSNGLVSSGKRAETYSGTTNSSGVYTVTFGTAYSVAPNIQASITNQGATNQYLRVSSVSTTGFTINAYSFSTNTLLGIVSLVSTTTNINGASVDVLVTEK